MTRKRKYGLAALVVSLAPLLIGPSGNTRGNTLSDHEIGRMDPWCILVKIDGEQVAGGTWRLGIRNGETFNFGPRVDWPDDPRPPKRLVRIPTSWAGTSVGIDPWCHRATEAQLRYAACARHGALDGIFVPSRPGRTARYALREHFVADSEAARAYARAAAEMGCTR